jgi:hypothetical protein
MLITLRQHGLRALDEVIAVVVADEEVEVSGLQQTLLQPGEHQRSVALGDLRHQHADGQRVAAAQRPRQHVGPVVEVLGGGEDALLGGLGDGLGRGRAIENTRDSRRRQAKVVGDHLQAGRPPATRFLWGTHPGIVPHATRKKHLMQCNPGQTVHDLTTHSAIAYNLTGSGKGLPKVLNGFETTILAGCWKFTEAT